MKKMMSLLLTVVLLVSMLPVGAMAAYDATKPACQEPGHEKFDGINHDRPQSCWVKGHFNCDGMNHDKAPCGVWGHYNYELYMRILRGEWGYEGSIMTDWWMRSSKSPEFPELKDQAYRVRAGVNVLMPGGGRVGPKKPDGTLLKTLGQENGITLGELQQNAAYILNFVMNSAAMK